MPTLFAHLSSHPTTTSTCPPLSSFSIYSTLVPRLIRASSVIQINWFASLILSLLNPPSILHFCVCVCDRDSQSTVVRVCFDTGRGQPGTEIRHTCHLLSFINSDYKTHLYTFFLNLCIIQVILSIICNSFNRCTSSVAFILVNFVFFCHLFWD